MSSWRKSRNGNWHVPVYYAYIGPLLLFSHSVGDIKCTSDVVCTRESAVWRLIGPYVEAARPRLLRTTELAGDKVLTPPLTAVDAIASASLLELNAGERASRDSQRLFYVGPAATASSDAVCATLSPPVNSVAGGRCIDRGRSPVTNYCMSVPFDASLLLHAPRTPSPPYYGTATATD